MRARFSSKAIFLLKISLLAAACRPPIPKKKEKNEQPKGGTGAHWH